MVEQRRSPGRWLYLLSLIIFSVGVLVAIVLAVLSVRHFTNLTHSFIRVVAPGTTTIELTESGTYTIFYEYESKVDGQTFSTSRTPPPIVVSITSAGTGAPVTVRSSGTSSSYSIGSHSGISVLTFKIDSPGAYQISSNYAAGATGQSVVLAIGHGFAKDLVGGIATIFGSVGIFCGMTFIAIVLTLVVFFLRQRKPSGMTAAQTNDASSL